MEQTGDINSLHDRLGELKVNLESDWSDYDLWIKLKSTYIKYEMEGGSSAQNQGILGRQRVGQHEPEMD